MPRARKWKRLKRTERINYVLATLAGTNEATFSQLSRMTGIGRSDLRRILIAERSAYGSTMLKISRALGCTIERMMKVIDAEKAKREAMRDTGHDA